MDQPALAAAWRALAPTGVAVEVMEYSASAVPGGAAEQAATLAMDLERRLEFLSGRRCARRALAALGVSAIDLPIAPDRGTQWPAGIVGSITHTRSPRGSWAVAAVARSANLSALGIDLECCELLDASAWDMVLTGAEREHIRAVATWLRADEASRIWCAKEAAIKAARGVTEPSAVQIHLSSDNHFHASKQPALGEPRAAGWELEGRSQVFQGYALAVAYRCA